MASRRSLRRQQPEEKPQRRRRSLRLARQKVEPFSYQRSLTYQAPTNSAQINFETPRTIFKKVLQTQPIASPFVSEKPDSPKPIETVFHFPANLSSSINLEVSLLDSTRRQKARIARHPTRSKKVRVSEFERDLNNQLHSSTAQGLLDNTSLTKSLQISFTTPAPLNSPGRKGLTRRPKSYRGVNVKDFEGGLEQNLLQIKDSAENNPEDQKTTTFHSKNTEALSAETGCFLPPPSGEENETEPSNILPEPNLARQSSGRRSGPSLSRTQLARQDEISDMEVENGAESSAPQILMPGNASGVEAETEPMEKDSQEKCQESSQDVGKELGPSLGEEKLSPGPEDASSIESISQERIVTPPKHQQKCFHGSSSDEELLTPTEPLEAGLGIKRSSVPINAELPGASQSYFSAWLSRKIVRPSVNEMVAQITKELDNIVPELAGPGTAKVDPEEGSSLREITVDISQSPRVAIPSRHASGKTPKTLERTPLKSMRDRTNPQTGDRNRTKEMRTVETEANDNAEVEMMSESEDIAVDISQSPRVATPSRRSSGKTPKTLERTPLKARRDRTNPQTGDRNRTKEMRTVETEANNNAEVEEMSESEDISVDISQSPRGATPSRRASGKTPKTLERTPLKARRDTTNPQTGDRNRTKEMNVETEQILEFEAENNPEVEEMSESEGVAVEISQSPRVATPNRRTSGKTPKTLERTPLKAKRDRTNPQTGDRNRTKEMRTVETEANNNAEDEEMSESEDIAFDISQSPRVATPSRRSSGKTPKTLQRTPLKSMRDRTNPQTGDRNRTKEMNVETEQILEFEAENNPEVEEMSESEVDAVDISQSPRVATPSRRASGKTPKTLERTPLKSMRDRTNPQTGDRNRTKEMRTVETEANDNAEVEEMSESEDIAFDISQSPRVATPSRRASGKTPKTLERTPLKSMRERTNPQTGDRNRTKEMRTVETEANDNTEVEVMSVSQDFAIEISLWSPTMATPSRSASGKTPKMLQRTRELNKMNVETEPVLEFEGEDNPEVEEMSESEDVEPTGRTPAFVHAKAFHCTPLLSSPQLSSPVLKEVASGLPVKQKLVQRVPKPVKKARREKQEPSIPSTLVKTMFTHYAKMPVTKEALQVVDKCVDLYFKRLSKDLEAYVNHARRKTAEPADLELLMRRQGLITDKTPLNVLVERHLPLEYRELLIPIAKSGNQVIPHMPK